MGRRTRVESGGSGERGGWGMNRVEGGGWK